MRFETEMSESASKRREIQAAITALEEVVRMLPRPTEERKTAEDLRPGTDVWQARRILQENGVPLHVDKILDYIGKPVTKSTKAGLSGSLSYYVRRGEIFTRPSPNTFGLLEFDEKKPAVPKNDKAEEEEIVSELADLNGPPDDDIPF